MQKIVVIPGKPNLQLVSKAQMLEPLLEQDVLQEEPNTCGKFMIHSQKEVRATTNSLKSNK